ncbi:hypothetical protein [Vulcanisaeta distributa]|uniref:hypothetical protein n=1 Tax=Vulcanisaeta distributa TaxID=164451 RepID=UPI0006D26D17|nr:hypothetical protein [Vulcanisaeta distributa]
MVRVLTARMLRGGDSSKALEVARRFTGYKQHSAAITINDLVELGIRVRAAAGREEELLWRLYESFITNVVKTEELLTPPDMGQEINIKLGRGGVLLARKPVLKGGVEGETE